MSPYFPCRSEQAKVVLYALSESNGIATFSGEIGGEVFTQKGETLMARKGAIDRGHHTAQGARGLVGSALYQWSRALASL